ncbi:spermatogenesis-defective protein 39 homolog isoform X1 [Festucalex cinctus]
MMKSRTDEEDYWNTSKFKAFTFEDEDDDLKESKEAVKSLPQLLDDDDDDDDDVEKVSWSGEPVGSISWSVRETAMASDGDAFPPRIIRTDAAPNLVMVNSGYSLTSLFKAGRKGANAATFADAFGDPSGRMVAPEIQKPKSEKQDLLGDWSPQEAVSRMQQGKSVSLERFRCLQDKMRLLDAAAATHDGNVITAVLIYLKKSLSKDVLFVELSSRQTALRHFINYLSESGDDDLLVEVYRSLGRTEDIALLQYKRHLSVSDENKRRDFLKSCLSLQFSPEDQVQVQDQVSLLERQMVLEAADVQAERGGKSAVFRKFPRRASVLHVPLITTLYYCCFYHYGQPEGNLSSPSNIRQSFKVSAVRPSVPTDGFRLTDGVRPSALGEAAVRDGAERPRQAEVVERRGRAVRQPQLVGIGQETLAARLPHRRRHPAAELRPRAGAAGVREPGGGRRDADVAGPQAQMSRPRHQRETCRIRLRLGFWSRDSLSSNQTYRDSKDRRLLRAYRAKVEAGSAAERKIDELLNNSQIRWKN